MKTRFLAAACGVFALSSIEAWCGTHCSPAETDYFSCEIQGSSKVLSLCGSNVGGGSEGPSWLQYRFGRIDHVELAYPRSKNDSVQLFERNYFNPHGEDHSVISIRFVNGQFLYEVALSSGKELSGGVSIMTRQNKNTSLFCRSIDSSYWSRLSEVVNTAGSNRDMLSDFYNAAGSKK